MATRKKNVVSPSGCYSGNEFKQWRKLVQIAVCLSGLPKLPPFDAVGEPATLAQRWITWKEKFELYVTASGISDPTQKRALVLHLAGPTFQIFLTTPLPPNRLVELKITTKLWSACQIILNSERMLPWLDKRFQRLHRRWERLSTTSSLACRN